MRNFRLMLAGVLAAGAAAAAEPEPCTDFYGWVNGAWLQATELPPDRARIGSFDQLRQDSERVLQRALAELAAAAEPPAAEGTRLVTDDWAAGMDEAAIERRGLGALQPWLARIDALEQPAQLPALLGALARVGVAAPLQTGVSSDAQDRRRHVLYMRQGGLGLPDRDDYLRDDDRAQALRSAYRRYAQRLLEGAGAPAGDAALDALLAFERRLAEASATRVQLRDPLASHNPATPATLAAQAPGLDWRAWLQAYAGRADAPLVVDTPAFMAALARLAAEAPPATWRSYLRVRLLDSLAPRLPRRFEEAAFDYRSRAVRGLRQPPPRAERVLREIADGPVSQGLGEVFVARAFPARAQQRAQAMVEDIRAAMATRIERLSWMGPATRERALAKLAAMQVKIGAPAQWQRYPGLAFRRDDYAGNGLAAAEWATRDEMARLDRPVDRARWTMSPHVVNAQAGRLNEILFPAAILQPPFFDPAADDATNYGAIGMVIGHEITHHFDDGGRRYDAYGNLADWWTAADAAAYQARADRVVALYEGYEPLPGQRINGRQTLGENISDLSGIAIAYDGLLLALKRNGTAPDARGADGRTPAQRFFIASATVWRAKERPESLANQLRTGVHSPAPYRALAPLANSPAFAAAFGCKAGSAMMAPDPVVVW